MSTCVQIELMLCDFIRHFLHPFNNVWRKAMQTKRCASCGKSFRPVPQTPGQRYCSDPACQRERRRKAQQKRRQSELTQLDHAQASRDWAVKNPDYSKKYRAANPEYVIRNRDRQSQRNQKRRRTEIAREAVSGSFSDIPSGRYRLTLIADGVIAKETSWIVEIAVLSAT